MKFAVLTGDIVNSTALGAAEITQIVDVLRDGVDDIADWSTHTMTTGFRQRGGDSWQAALSEPTLALRAALYLRAIVRRIAKTHDTRIALAEGPGTLPADGDTNAAHGPAFTASGRLLTALPSGCLMSHAAGGAKAAAVVLADQIARGWTPAQARAMAELLPPAPGTHLDAAKRIGVSRQAVDQALHAAGFAAIEAALHAWEQANPLASPESKP